MTGQPSLMRAVIQQHDDDMALKSEATAYERRLYLRQFVDWAKKDGIRSWDEVTPDDVHNYLKQLKRDDYSSSAIRSAYYSISKLYKDQFNQKPPTDDLTPKDYINWGKTKREEESRKEIHPLDPDDVQELIDHLPAPKLRNELIVKLLFQTGIRQEEAVTIELHDIDWETRRIDVYSDKTDDRRDVWYPQSLQTLMQHWRDVRRPSYPTSDQSDRLLITRKKPRMRPNYISRIIKNAAKDAGLNRVLYEDNNGHERWKVTGHILRHSYAVEAVRNGIDIRRLQKLMGHSNIEITETYLDFKKDSLREAAEANVPRL